MPRATPAIAIPLLLLATLALGLGAGEAPPVAPAAGPVAEAPLPIPAGDAPAAQVPPSAGPVPGPALPAGYLLYPGDLLVIRVFDHDDLTTEVRIPTTGAITFPLIGTVDRLVGRSVEDFSAEISTRLKDGFIRKAMVTISIREMGPRLVYVMGSVQKPSAVELNPFVPITAMQAIGKAGGFAEDADRGTSQVIREEVPGSGLKVGLAIPALDSASALTADVVLRAGDLIIVPRQDRVYIIGQVHKPGAVNLPSQEPLTVSKAVSIAGGFDRFARTADVQLIRPKKPIRTVNVKAILDGDKKLEDPRLEPGDTVYVPEGRF